MGAADSPFMRLVGTFTGVQNAVEGFKDARRKDDKDKLEQEELNPDSPLSRSMREQIGGVGIKIPDSTSAAEIKKNSVLMKAVETAISGEQSRRSKALEMGQNPNKMIFEKLPIENQEQVKDLAKSTATKTTIKNHIDSALEILSAPDVSEDQKITTGSNLLKTLNSAEGKDAVGSEEAKRLGSFLEYKIANFRQPGSFVGRDLDQFTEQVRLKSEELGQAAARDKAHIDSLYGRKSKAVAPISASSPEGGTPGGVIGKSAKAKAAASPEDQAAYAWAKANPKDPRAKEIAKRLKERGF